jgi:hypothetical protein
LDTGNHTILFELLGKTSQIVTSSLKNTPLYHDTKVIVVLVLKKESIPVFKTSVLRGKILQKF